MKKLLTGDEVKKVELDILSKVHEFCKERGINYFLHCGTLLGAIRHKGFIPWDDDIDIGMMKEDYERFCKEFMENPPKDLKLCNVDTVKGYYLSMPKIIDTRTGLIETELKGCEIGVYIDIFYFDAIPPEGEQKDDFIRRLTKLRTMLTIKNARSIPDWSRPKQLLLPFFKMALLVVPKKKLIKKIIKTLAEYTHLKDSEYVGSLHFTEASITKRTCFDEYVTIPYEDREFQAPRGYEDILVNLYGDYMKLPPEDKRVARHCFDAWWKE